jgi:hypothetical protein
MRYIANSAGYLLEVSFGAMMECNGQECTEYTGGVPAGYSSLADWFSKECDKLYRWHIVAGELALDSSAQEPVLPSPGGGPGGVIAPVNGFFTLSVDENGDLWAHTSGDGTVPEFEYDSATGNLYFITE